MTQFIDAVISEMLRNPEPFRSEPWYDQTAEVVYFMFTDAPSYMERISPFITLYRRFDGDTLNGVALKNVRKAGAEDPNGSDDLVKP